MPYFWLLKGLAPRHWRTYLPVFILFFFLHSTVFGQVMESTVKIRCPQRTEASWWNFSHLRNEHNCNCYKLKPISERFLPFLNSDDGLNRIFKSETTESFKDSGFEVVITYTLLCNKNCNSLERWCWNLENQWRWHTTGADVVQRWSWNYSNNQIQQCSNFQNCMQKIVHAWLTTA